MRRLLLILSCFVSLPALAHPLDPLTAGEIDLARTLVEASNLCKGHCYYPFMAHREPNKSPVLTHAHVPREAQVTLLDRDENLVWDIIVNLDEHALTRVQRVPGAQPLIMIEEMNQLPALVRAHPDWQAAMRRRGITDLNQVHIDGWAQGYDDDESVPRRRIMRALSFFRGTGTNAYARPIEGVVAVVNMTDGVVERIVDRGVVPIAPEASDFFDAADVGPSRKAAAPLLVTQPQGPAFDVDGQHVRWQNWSFRFAMQPREGLVLYAVGYEDGGALRSIMWRGSLSEMVVPYGDPDPSWSWRSAFDVGEYGIGRLASPLTQGVEVPDNARLFPAVFSDDFGHPYTAQNVTALYERDAGLAWKHYDINTGRNAARRGRELVLSFITTVGNYDYALQWVFGQDGSLRMETELTGIMLAKGVAEGEAPEHAHIVAPGVAAPHHQHYFAFRLDMDVDGVQNSLVEMNTYALEAGAHNPHDNGMVMEETLLASESEAQRNMRMASSRKWAVLNTERLNTLGAPTGYALIPGENSLPYARATSFARKRAGFIEHHVWGTRYHADELYAAGDYPNQSHSGGEGLPRFVANDESLVQEDLVLWYSLGVTHIPRPEEWPVMPTTKVGFTLLPVGFFTRNPALDLPTP